MRPSFPLLRSVGRCLAFSAALIAMLMAGVAPVSAATDKTPTVTALAVTSQPSQAKGAQGKTLLTLTASVTAAGQPLTRGEVQICDANAAHCLDIHRLGRAQLTKAGTAVFRLVRGPGSYAYTAIFMGTQVYARSVSARSSVTIAAPAGSPTASRSSRPIARSATAQELAQGRNLSYAQVMSGRYVPARARARRVDAVFRSPAAAPRQSPSATTSLTASGSPGAYSLAATVLGENGVSPTGTVSFQDVTGGVVLGTAALVPNLPLSFHSLPAFGTIATPTLIATGDFNNDGVPDLAVAAYAGVDIYLGNGDGTFDYSASLPVGDYAFGLAVGDFNGDGALDVVVTDYYDQCVFFFAGNGDGAFQSPVISEENDGLASALTVGDFNGDGIPDLAVVNDQGPISILYGDGFGDFYEYVSPVYGSFTDQSQIVAEDFNADGNLDLAVTGSYDANQIQVFTGDGQGDFNNIANVSTGNEPTGLAAADLNGDGVLDLVATNESDGTLTVALGAGDGTFPALSTVPDNPNSSPYPVWVGVADFAQNGHDGLAVVNSAANTVSLFPGDGTGAFTAPPVSTATGNYPVYGAIADFNLDGYPDVAVANQSDSTVSLDLTRVSAAATATATLSGVAVYGAGTHQAQADYGGDGNYPAGSSNQVALAAQQVTTTLSLQGTNASSATGQNITLTATLSPSTAGPYSTNGEPIAFSQNGAAIGTGTLSGGAASFSSSTLNPNSGGFSAAYAGDGAFTSSSATLNGPLTAEASVGIPSGVLMATVTLPNGGTPGAIAVLTQGAPNRDFQIGSPNAGTCAVGATYAAGATCTVEYTFTPTRPGQRRGAVVLESNASPAAPLGTALLVGTGTGPLAVFPGSTAVSTAGSGISTPYGVAVDGAGDVFVVDVGNALKEIEAGTGGNAAGAVSSSSTVVTVGSGNIGVAVDGAGNVFVSDPGNGAVEEIEVGTGGNAAGAVSSSSTEVAVGSGFFDPYGVAVDGAGNVFVADYKTVKEIEAGTGGNAPGAVSSSSTVMAVGSGFAGLFGVAVDGAGDVFADDYSNAAVKEIEAGTGGNAPGVVSSSSTVATVGSGFAEPWGVAVDGAGNVFVSDVERRVINEIEAGTGGNAAGAVSSSSTVVTVRSGYSFGVAVDGAGDVFFADDANNAVQEIALTTPPALSFGSTAVGGSSSAALAVQNAGNAPLVFTAPEEGGNPSLAAGFTLAAGSTCPEVPANASASSLAAGTTCTEEIEFTPAEAGGASGSLITTDNNLNVAGATQTVTLSGTGLAATGTAAQTITFPQPATPAVPGTTATLQATASSGLPIVYSVVSGPATVSGSAVTYSGAGTVVLQAGQYGNNVYAAATPAQQTVAVALSLAIGSPSGAQTATVTFTTAGTLGSIAVLTEGAANQDFQIASPNAGTCAVGTQYAAGTTCTVDYTFTPTVPGVRLGAVQLMNAAGVAIAAAGLSGTGAGPLVTYPGNVLTAALPSPTSGGGGSAFTGYLDPQGTAVDGNGDVFVADSGNHAVEEIPFHNGSYGTPIVLAGSAGLGGSITFGQPSAVAVDGGGNVYVSDPGNVAVYQIEAAGGAVSSASPVVTLGGSARNFFSRPEQLAFDPAGNLYIVDAYQECVIEVPAVNGAIAASTNAQDANCALNYPTGIAFDAAGDAFVVDQWNLDYFPAANGTANFSALYSEIPWAVGPKYPNGFAVAADLNGNLFVTDTSNHDLVEVPYTPGHGYGASFAVPAAGGVSQPTGVMLDAYGNLFVTDAGTNAVDTVNFQTAPSLAFQSANVGATSADSPQTVQIYNYGNAPLVFSAPATGDNPSLSAGFEFSVGTTCTPVSAGANPFSLAAGTGCADAIGFAPTVAGTVSGSLTATDNNLNIAGATQTVSLSGTGISPAPTATGISPTSGPAAGGTTLIITGQNLEYQGTPGEVTVGAQACAATGTQTSTQLTCAVPAGVGQASVAVTTAAGSVVAGQFLYNAPVVASISPTGGPVAGGTPVTITGNNFGPSGSATVLFGAQPGAVVTASNTQITVTAPPGSPGPVNVTVATASGGSSPVPFTYQLLTKTISFPTPATPATVNGTATLDATTSNGDPVVYSVTAGTASVTGNRIAFTNAGTVTIEADSAATADYAAAAPVSQTVTVNPAAGSYAAPATPVASTSPVQTATVNFTAGGTLGAISVITRGATGKDFNLAPGGTCAVDTAYTAGQACTVEYAFAPRHPGQRLGAAQLMSATGSAMGTSLVSGIGVGPQLTFTSPLETTLGSGFQSPRSVAVDGNGNVYVADTSHNAVKEIVAVNGGIPALNPTVEVLGGGFTQPAGLAVDGAGNLYVADSGNGDVKELVAVGGVIPAANPTILILGTGFTALAGIAADAGGDVFAVDAGAATITEIPAGCDTSSCAIPFSGLSAAIAGPEGIAVDANGDLFVADGNNHQRAVMEIHAVNGVAPASGATVTQVATLTHPYGVGVDANGDLLVADDAANAVYELLAVNGALPANPTVLTLWTNLLYPQQLALDGSGGVYVADTANNAIRELNVVTPPAIAFGSASVGLAGAAETLTATNDGNQALSVAGIATGTGNFTVGAATASSGSTATSLAPGGTLSIPVSFTPQAVGSLSDTLSITDNSLNVSGAVQQDNLSGASTQQTPVVTVSPASTPYQTAATALSAQVAFGGGTAPTGAVTFSVDGGAATVAACSGTTSPLQCTASYPTGALAAPTHTITASVAADTNFAAASGTATLIVTPIAPTISFAVASQIYGAGPVTLAATSNSGGAFTYSVVGGPASIAGSVLTIAGAGTVTVEAAETANGDYTSGTQNAGFSVGQAQLEVAIAGTPAKTYDGTASATLTSANFGVTGLIGSDSITVTQTAGAYASANAGAESVMAVLAPANYVAGSGSLSNYMLPPSAIGAGLIHPAAASATPNAATKVYGTSDPAFTGTLTGFLPADNVTAAYTRAPGETVPGSPYAISATLAPTSALGNYTIAYNTAPFTITQAAATVTLGDLAQMYTGSPLAATASSNPSVQAINLTYNGSSTAPTQAGSYAVAAAVSDPNYTGAATGTLVIHPALPGTLSFAPNPASVPYNTPLTAATLDASLSGTDAGNGAVAYAIGSAALAAGATPAAGTYTVTATFTPTGATASDFTSATATAQLTIAPIAAGTLTLANISTGYGAGLTAAQLSAQLTGNDAGGMGTTAYSIGGTTAGGQPLSEPVSVGSIPPAGAYTLKATFTPGGANCATCSNFTAISATANLTVSAAPLTITASSPSAVYGGPLPPITPLYTGLAGGDTAASLPTPPVCATTASSASTAGGYPTSCSGAADPNYAIRYAPGALAITPATLTVAANSLSLTYGDYRGTAQLAYTVTGFQLGQTAQTDLWGVPQETTSAPDDGTAGSYTITVSQGLLKLKPPYNQDYTIVYQAAPLVISPAVLTVTATSQTDVYGSTDPDHCGNVSRHLAYTISGFAYGQSPLQVLRGAPAETTTAGANANAGTYPITITAGTLVLNPPLAGDYTLAFVNGSLTVTPASLTVVANSYNRPVHAANPIFGYTIRGFVNGDTQATALTGAPACCSTAATAATPAGDYTIAIGPGSLTANHGNYAIQYLNGVLVVYDPNNVRDPHNDGHGGYCNNFTWDRQNWPDPASFNFYWGSGSGPVISPWIGY